MKKFKTVATVFGICLLCWFTLDFTLTALGLGPWKITTFVKGMPHAVYHHDLKPNLNNTIRWGNVFYQICTNEYGFKIACSQENTPSLKNYDIAFIGDSFTEAVGMVYEDSFVGMFAAQNPKLSVVNLGCASYAPTVYLKKMEDLLQRGFTFKHVVVGIDISDIQDEGIAYALSADGSKVIDKATLQKNAPPHAMASSANAVSSATLAPANTQPETTKLKVETKPAPDSNKRRQGKYFAEQYLEYTWFLNLIVDSMLNPDLSLKRFDTQPYRSGWTHLQDVAGTYGPEGVAGAQAQAIDSMTKLKTLLDAHGITMSVLVYPWPAQLMYAPRTHAGVTLWQEFCQQVQCANFINANDIFYDAIESSNLEQVINENYIRGDFHFNRTGNLHVYQAIQKALEEDRIIP